MAIKVVDASVGIKWIVEESGSDEALQILAEVLEFPQDFAVPELFYWEITHVYHKNHSNI